MNSELCLDDGSVLSVYTRRERQFQWELPENRADAHWKMVAKSRGIKNIEKAYDDDDARWEAEYGMLTEALERWDDRVLRDLRRGLSTPHP